MSHVEPRSNYMFGNIAQPLTPTQQTYSNVIQQNPYTGYAIGGRIGYANGPGPVQVEDPFNYFAPSKNLPGSLPPATETEIMKRRRLYDEEQNAAQQSNREKLGITSLPMKRGDEFLSSIFGEQTLDDDIKLLMDKGLIPKQTEGKPYIRTKKDQEYLDQLKLARETGAEAEKYASEDIAPSRESTNKTTAAKNPKYQETREQSIRKETDFIKSLIQDPSLTTAENALLIARALGTPGGINAKIAAAGDLALPILRERSKLDKDAVLKAYAQYGDIEKAKIAASKPPAQIEMAKSIVENKMKIAQEENKVTSRPDGTLLYNGKTETELMRDAQNESLGRLSFATKNTISQQIAQAENSIKTLMLDKKPDLNVIQKKQNEINRLKGLLQGEVPGGYENGGRVNKAFGGDMSTTTFEEPAKDQASAEDIISTNGPDNTPMKPVQKLSYEEIRNRLPKEITNDIVKLLSDSSEALQDFAYIKSQQDVNAFNVKYGVNLVLPRTA
jgi:hypothetical protein